MTDPAQRAESVKISALGVILSSLPSSDLSKDSLLRSDEEVVLFLRKLCINKNSPFNTVSKSREGGTNLTDQGQTRDTLVSNIGLS